MDHLDLEEDQREKLRQYTEFTHQHDYDVAVGTLASLNWNLEQAIEAHLMQEDMNDDDDPEILEAVPPRSSSNQNKSGSSTSSNGRRVEPEVIDIEAEEMPAARGGRRRGRTATSDEATTVDNQIDDDPEDRSKTSRRGDPIPRQGKRGQAAEQGTSSASSSTSSSAASSSTHSRRHARGHPVPSNQEPAEPEAARENGTSLRRVPMVPRHARQEVAAAPQIEDSDDDEDAMNIAYDDDDDMDQNHQNGEYNETGPRGGALTNGRVPMIPDGYTSVPDALRNFVSVFSNRFCSTPATQAFMPPFYTDTLPNALKEAFENPNMELRRPLVFYINHDRSIASNIFASQVMCSEDVSSLIRHQYVLFPWDISSDSNLMHFLDFLQACNMGDVRNMIQRLAVNKIETFPMMAIVIRERNSYRLVDYCRGTDTADQVMGKLLAGVEEYSNVRLNEASERREREEREAIRNQQEAEYKASLEADKARMEAKQREIEEQRLEEERKQKEIEDEAIRRQTVASTLPEEPPANAPAAEIINVKFRLPEGGQDMRRFRRSESIQTLIDYLSSKGFAPDKYKYFNSDFPKKEITRHFDLSNNFTTSKWPAREQIFVEEI
uniref:UBX domain-containing protein n=1 Tax=Caenorhabditis tropicalis TaxID=1561998 RepID=A0A1I7TG77_9PELO